MKAITRALLLLALLAVFLGGTGFAFRREIAREVLDFYTLPDSRRPADFVFVMSGDAFERLPLAVEIHNTGLADRIVCTIAPAGEHSRRFHEIFGFLPDEEHVVRRALETIPELDYRLMTGTLSTYDDILLLKQAITESNARSALIVSSPWHFRRIQRCLATVFGPESGIEFYFAHEGLDEHIRSLNDPDDAPLIAMMETMKQLGYVLKY